MGKIQLNVPATCGSSTLVILRQSCAQVLPSLVASVQYVQVAYSGAVFQAAVSVAQASAASIWVNATKAALGQPVPYRVLATLSGGAINLPAADVTQMVAVSVDASALQLSGPQVTCLRVGTFIVAASATSVSIQCVASKDVAAAQIVAFSPGIGGLGSYTFAPAVLQPSAKAATGATLLVYADGSCMLLAGLASADPTRLTTSSMALTLAETGQSSRCVMVLGAHGAYARVPAIQATPAALLFVLSATALVVSTDTSGLMPTSATVYASVVQLTDGAVVPRPPVLNSSSLAIANGTVYAPPYPVAGAVQARILSMPCVSSTVEVDVYQTSILEVTLGCPSCQPLTLPDDPLSQLYPAQYPSQLAAAAFVLTARLQSGQTIPFQAPLVVTVAATLAGGTVYAQSPGSFQVSLFSL